MIKQFLKYFAIGFATILILIFSTSYFLVKSYNKVLVEDVINIELNKASKNDGREDNSKTLDDVKNNMGNTIPDIVFIVFIIVAFLGIGHQICIRLGLIDKEEKNED